MARPRVVKTKDGGEVTLKNVSPEVADQVKALLTGKGAPAEEAEAPEEPRAPAAPVAPKAVLTHIALGTFQHPHNLHWYVATVKYNPLSGEAIVESTVKAGVEPAEAQERFKILAVSNNIV